MMAINQTISIARNISYKVLYDVYYNHAYSNLSIKKHFKALKKDEDKALATNIIFGTIKNDKYLSDVIKELSSIEYDKIKQEIALILKAGIYQLYFMDRVPAYAVVNDSVNIAKFYVSNKTGSFVNAVLRNANRQKAQYMAGRKNYPVPMWLIDYLSKFYDQQFLDKLTEDFLDNPPTFIRVNQLKSKTEDAYEFLNKDGKTCEKTFMPDVFKVIDPSAILSSALFASSTITIQDISAALCAYVLDPKDKDSILDLCAAPGGKSLHIASLTNNKAFVTACDIHKHKVELMQNIFKQYGAQNIVITKNDAESYTDKFDNKFDKVIADVPCSGLGVIKRKPEILLHLHKEDIQNLIQIQKRIIKNAARYVKSKGILLYCTCSINPEENELLIKQFLLENKEFTLCDIVLPDSFDKYIDTSKKGEIKLFSHDSCGDGFYICKMMKN